MSKVLILGNSDLVVYNFRLELVERLLGDGHEVFVCSPYGERIDDLKALGCKFIDINISRHGTNPIKELKLLKEYKRIIKNVNPDIVFTYTIKPNIYGALACKKFKIPCVANITGLGTAVENGGLIQRATVFLYKIAFKNIKKVFFQNQENMDFFKSKKIAPNKHDLLPGSGVNLQRFSPIEYPKKDTIEFAFISRIMKEKGIDQYLESAKIIREKYPNTVFHVCGFFEQEYKEIIDDLVSKNIIVYHGMVRDVKRVLKDIHCTVHPTYYPEGIANVLLESSACARPIITTDRSGCREVIDDGVNGYIVKMKDSADLTLKIEKFINLPYEEKVQMGLNGRKKVEDNFDRQIVVEKYIGELNSI